MHRFSFWSRNWTLHWNLDKFCIGILTNSIAIGISLGAGAGLVLGAAHGTAVKKEKRSKKI